jgi:uncharacterized protein (DUF2235 family)
LEKVRQLAKRRNVVILCDGTSNEPGPTRTNVARLFKGIEKSHRQISFYDPGIGTFGYVAPWSRRLQRVGATLAQATGYGLDDNVLDAYRFLCSEHQVGDRIMLFGFSRGAYTVRVLAGLIHLIGVLRPEHVGLAPLALKAYKQSGEAGNMTVGWDVANALGARPAVIDFVGVWDTVSSVIVPLKDRLAFDLQTLPYTRKNPSVAVFRHAMAIDERRRMFRLNRWIEGQQHVPDRFDRTSAVPQDSLQVWFAGAHGDVGGGHSEQDSGLSLAAVDSFASLASIDIPSSQINATTLLSSMRHPARVQS